MSLIIKTTRSLSKCDGVHTQNVQKTLSLASGLRFINTGNNGGGQAPKASAEKPNASAKGKTIKIKKPAPAAAAAAATPALEDVASRIVGEGPSYLRQSIEDVAVGQDRITQSIEDPQLRERTMIIEKRAARLEAQKRSEIERILNCSKPPAQKIRELIAIKAPSATIINAMHNLLGRVTSFNAKHKPNIDNLDPIRYSRDWLEEDFNPSGYDIENSSDPDTLPQQRSFTREELNRVLQDVEASKHCETDLEDQLILPFIMMDQVNREIIKHDLQRGLDAVVSEVPAPESAQDEDDSSMAVPLSDITPEVSVQDYGYEDSGMPIMLAIDQDAREPDREARRSPTDPPAIPFVSSPNAQLAAHTFAGNPADAHMRAPLTASATAAVPEAVTVEDGAAATGAVGATAGGSSASTTGSGVGNIQRKLVGLSPEDQQLLVQQHNASALQARGDVAPGANKSYEVDSIIDRELAAKVGPSSPAMTQNVAFAAQRRAPRDPRVLGQIPATPEQEVAVATDIIMSEADWFNIAKDNVEEIQDIMRKLSSEEAEALLKSASSLSSDEFKSRVAELAANMKRLQDVAFDGDKNEVFGEPKEDAAKVASKYAKEKAEKVQQPLFEKYPTLGEFDDDDDRHDAASDYEGPDLVNTPGMTLHNARHMIETMVQQDVWARYYDSRPGDKYYKPVVLNATVDTLASDDDPGVVNKMPHHYPEAYLPSLAVRVVQRAQAVIAQKIVSPRKMRRIREGLLRYTNIPPALINAITMNKQSLFDDDTPLSPKLRKELDEAAMRWLSKHRERKPLATEEEIRGVSPEKQALLAAKRNAGEDTFSDDALDLGQRAPLEGEKVRNYLKAVADKYGLPIPQATLDSQAFTAVYDKPHNAAEDNHVDASGTDFDTDMDEMIGEIAAELATRAESSSGSKRRVFDEENAEEEGEDDAEIDQADLQELEEEAEAGDTEGEERMAALQISKTQTETLLNMIKEGMARAQGQGKGETTGFNSLDDVLRAEGPEADLMRQVVAQLRQDQANSLRRLYALNPDYARALVAKASLESMTPGQYAVSRASQLFGQDEHKSEDEDPAETALKAFKKSAENNLFGDFEQDPTLPEAVKQKLREMQKEDNQQEVDEEEEARLKAQATGFDFTAALAEYEHALYQLSLQKDASGASTDAAEKKSTIKSVADPVASPLRRGEMAPVFVDSFFDMGSSDAVKYAAGGEVSTEAAGSAKGTKVSQFVPIDHPQSSSAHVLGILNFDGLTQEQQMNLNMQRISELEKREREVRAAISEQLNPVEDEDDANDQLEAVSDEESLKMIVGEEEEDEELDASQDETEIFAPYRAQELYQITPMRVPNAARDLQKDPSIRDINVVADIHARQLKQKFFDGTLPGDEYNFLLANNRETEFQMGLDLGEDGSGAADLRKYRRELLLQGRRAREEYEERLNEYEDSPSVRTEPQINSKYELDDEDEHLMTRRITPYDLSEPGYSHMPPIIGIEQQTNLYHLHKLDPVTFHPRWIARRLNIEPAYVIGMLKGMDLLHKSQLWAHQLIPRIPSETPGDVSLDAGENAQADQVDITPAELHLEESDVEFVYGGELPFMIGKVSWDDSIYRDPAWEAEPWADLVWYQDSNARAIRAEEARRHRRWASKQQREDAIERASFARFGPVHWASGRNTVHRPPKMPREIISTTIFPPSRHNWILTDLSEAKSKSTFAICVRDKDGYLRHPTFREFKNVRYRERDRRLPFYLREYEVIAKVPEISSVYISQLATLRENIEIVKPVIPPERNTDNPFSLDGEEDGVNEEEIEVQGAGAGEQAEARR